MRALPHHQDTSEALDILKSLDKTYAATAGMLLMMAELYEQMGEGFDVSRVLKRLVGELDNESDVDLLHWTRGILSVHSEIDSSLLTELSSVKNLLANTARSHEPTPTEQRKLSAYDIPGELKLARRLQQARLLKEEDYAILIQDLCEPTQHRIPTPCTLLHCVRARDLSAQERIIEYLVQDGNLPLVNLDGFTPPPEEFFGLPPVFVQNRAAAIFGLISEDAMVAVLNPYNNTIQNDAAAIIGRTCHFFLATSDAYDRLLLRAAEGSEISIEK